MAKYIKHSLRQVHTPCAGCGSDKLFFAHELVGAVDPTSETYCQKCEASGPLVLVDMNTLNPHSCTGSPTGDGSGGGSGNSEGENETPGKPESQDLADWEKELLGDKPSTPAPSGDPWVDGTPGQDGIETNISEQLQQVSEANDAEMVAAQTVSEELALGEGERDIMNGSNRENPFPKDDEFVTHAELHEQNPASFDEVKAEFENAYKVVDLAANMTMRHGGRIAQLSAAMIELERRTRVTIVINNAATDEEVMLEGLHHQQLGDVIRIMSVEHCLMVGGAGAGKGEIAFQTAEALGIPFYSLDQGSLSPQTPVSALIGYMNSSGNYVGTTFRQAFEHGGLIFLDELDNAHAACLATINAALAIREGQMLGWPGGQMVARHKDFRVLAAANTFGRGPDRTYAARQRGDAATWDRFSILNLKYDHGLEDVLCRQTGLDEDTVVNVIRYVRALRANVEKLNLPVVVGMRASIGMCRLLQAGLDKDAAIDARCRRGMTDADWEKVSHNCNFGPLPKPLPPATVSPVLQTGVGVRPVNTLKTGGKVDGKIRLPDTSGNGMTGEYFIRWPDLTDVRFVISEDIMKLTKDGQIIPAIKALRSNYNELGVVYARTIIETIKTDLKGITPPPPQILPPAPHPDEPPWIMPEEKPAYKPKPFGIDGKPLFGDGPMPNKP